MKLYDTWERYFDLQHPKHKYQRARFRWLVERVKGKKFLDVGCAGGLSLYLVAKNEVIKELHGVDINPESIKDAESRLRKCPDKKTILQVGRAECLEKESNYFGTVMCVETLEHLKDDRPAMAELYRVTKTGGTLLVSVPDRGHTSIQHLRLYTKDSLRKLTEGAGFTVVEEYTMPSAPRQRYWYLLLRAIKDE